MKTSKGQSIRLFSDTDPTIGDLVAQRGWVMIEGPSADGQDAAPSVFLSVSHAPDGRVVCDGLIVGDLAPTHKGAPREITARSLREIRIPNLLQDVVDVTRLADRPGNRSLALDILTAGEASPRVRRAQLPDQHFKDVADAYREAIATIPRSPTKWLAKRLHVSEPTARRWVQRARDKGYLGESTPGKAGEKPVKANTARKGKR